MEVHKLNASLNWDCKHDANPWDLRYATVDLAMRCYPTNQLQIPIKYVKLLYGKDLNWFIFFLFLFLFSSYIQTEGQRGYSTGVEYTYNIFNTLNNNKDGYYYGFYDEDDLEELQQEQEDELYVYWC